MQKIKLFVLDKMIEKKVTAAEIDFIINISHYQDDKGNVKGVYYKNICNSLKISYQKFYDLKVSLVNKNIIRVYKEDYTDWNVQILDNDFSYPESYKEGYINTNHEIFYCEDFLNLKAGEKLLAMQFLKISNAGRGSYNIGVEKFYKKYTTVFSVTKRVIQNYITKLRKFFSIGIKEHQYWITPLARVFKKDNAPSDANVLHKHIGHLICRREKVQYNSKSFKDAITLMKQYGTVLHEQILEVFCLAVKKSIQKANEHIKNKSKWNRILQPKLVHKMLKEEILALGL